MNLAEKAKPVAAPRTDLDRLLALEHPDPHSILGAHPAGDRVVVRAFRPGASRIYLLVDGSVRREMTQSGDTALFEVVVPDRSEVARSAEARRS
ncbi:MAG TPA: hypothetical protein VMV27_03665 [Candidatus Binataceae bacterium]|nr:hypothetical protein [Candidatus Binataceae bacterium]